MNFKIGDIIYEDFEGNSQLLAGVYEGEITRIDDIGVYVSGSKEYPDEELRYPFSDYGIWWFSSLEELYKHKLGEL